MTSATGAQPAFAAALERLRAVAVATRQLPAVMPNETPDVAACRIRLSEGVAALAGERVIDWPTLRANAATLAAHVDATVIQEIARLADVMGGPALVEAALAGELEASGAPHAAITLLDYASRPALRAAAAQLREIIAESGWSRGTCPACAALPLLAELHSSKGENARVLRCGRCETAWSMTRLACPACDERDHTKLRYLHVEGEMEHRRAECCTTCGFYLKAVATLDPLKDDALLDADLATLALDTLAIEAGYHRRSGA